MTDQDKADDADAREKQITCRGITLSIAGWAKRLGLEHETLRARLKRMSVEKALHGSLKSFPQKAARLKVIEMCRSSGMTWQEIADGLGTSKSALINWHKKHSG